MKKSEIVAEIKKRLGQTSLSDRTIEAYVSNTMPNDGEVDDGYFDSATSLLGALGGQFSHDVANQVKLIRDSKNKNPKQTQSVDGEEERNKEDFQESEEISSLLKQLSSEIEQLKSDIKGGKVERSREQVVSSVVAQGESLKVRNKALWEDSVRGVSFEEGFTDADVLVRAKESYERNLKKYLGDGAVPYATADDANQREESDKNARNAYLSRLQSEGKIPKD